VQPATQKDLDEVSMIIYQIRNKVNGKSYVGQTINTFNRRYDGTSWWRFGPDRSRHLANSAKKHGKENFEIFILERNVESEDKLNELEIYHIARLNCVSPNGYNYQAGGQKMKNRGHNQETRDRMALSQSGGKKYRLLNNKTGVVHEFVNMQRFADENNISGPMICVMLNRKKSKQGGKYYSQHREWTLPEFPLRKVLCKGPNGEREIVLNGVDGGVKGFCRRRGFPHTSNVFGVINGLYSQAYGWTFEIL